MRRALWILIGVVLMAGAAGASGSTDVASAAPISAAGTGGNERAQRRSESVASRLGARLAGRRVERTELSIHLEPGSDPVYWEVVVQENGGEVARAQLQIEAVFDLEPARVPLPDGVEAIRVSELVGIIRSSTRNFAVRGKLVSVTFELDGRVESSHVFSPSDISGSLRRLLRRAERTAERRGSRSSRRSWLSPTASVSSCTQCSIRFERDLRSNLNRQVSCYNSVAALYAAAVSACVVGAGTGPGFLACVGAANIGASLGLDECDTDFDRDNYTSQLQFELCSLQNCGAVGGGGPPL